jgi:hypothetical protein
VICEYNCLVTSYFFLIVNFLGLAAPEWFFSLFKDFSLRNQNICVYLFLALYILVGCLVLITHTHTLGVIFIFQLVSELVHSVFFFLD